MKKILTITLAISLIIVSIPLASPFVSDRQNHTINADIAGYLNSGLLPSRIDGGEIYIGDESGLFNPNHRGYAKFNTTRLGNFTYNNSKIESMYTEFAVKQLTGWDSGDDLNIRRLNGTYIDATNPIAVDLSNLIIAGANLNITQSLTAGSVYNKSIDGPFVLSWSDLKTQSSGDGYFSIGFNEGSDVSSDEFIYLNGTDTFPPKLIVQTSCLPPATFFASNNWIVNKTCIIDGEPVNIYGNLTIQSAGDLRISNTTIRFMNNKTSMKIQGKLTMIGNNVSLVGLR